MYVGRMMMWVIWRHAAAKTKAASNGSGKAAPIPIRIPTKKISSNNPNRNNSNKLCYATMTLEITMATMPSHRS